MGQAPAAPGSPAAAPLPVPGIAPAVTGLNSSPASTGGAARGAGSVPVLPAGPLAPAAPAAPSPLPETGGVTAGSGTSTSHGGAGLALLLAAALLALASTRRRTPADAPSTSAILCPDEVPG
jgi:hypothetical protein